MGYTLQQARDAVLRVLSKPGNLGSAVTVRQLWPTLRRKLAPRDIEQLAQVGLAFEVNQEQQAARSVSDGFSPEQVVTVGSLVPETRAVSVMWVQIQYTVESGESKSLLHFTADDAQFVASQHRAKAAGLLDVANFMDAVDGALNRHRVKTVEDLPAKAKASLAKRWPFRIAKTTMKAAA